MFVADINKGRIYNLNTNSQGSALLLAGALADKIANTDTETQLVIFGEGFGRLTDLKVGSGDGYLYALSISDGAVYRILPKSTVASSSFPETPVMQELEKDNEMRTESSNGRDESGEENAEEAGIKLADRIEQINEQESRGGLNQQQVNELQERIEALSNNLGCR